MDGARNEVVDEDMWEKLFNGAGFIATLERF